MKREKPLLLLILMLVIVLLLLISLAVRFSAGSGSSEATGTDTPNAQPSGTEDVQTSLPAQTDPPPTQTDPPPSETDPPPTEPNKEYIGTLYTRDELETLDSTLQGYGPGSAVDSKNRPTGATSLDTKYKKYDAYFIGPDDGNVYFTFNCGYEYNNLTSDILDTLKQKNVKCVFFVNMYFVKSNPELIQRIINEGHTLANHCTNHPDLPNLSLDEMVTEIMTIHDYVLEKYGYKMTLFRPPSGYYSEQMLAVVQSLGYKTVNFSFSYVDWDPENPMDVDTAREKLISKAHSGAIYQLHTVSSTNAAILGDVIDALRDQELTPALFS